jgi:hypothetical protein
MHRGEDLFCPAYEPPTLGGLVVGIERRLDYEYARSLVFGWGVDGRVIEDKESVQWWEGGFCSLPLAPTFVSYQSPVHNTRNDGEEQARAESSVLRHRLDAPQRDRPGGSARGPSAISEQGPT